jgi:DNA-binding NarL/FixJ family response regulator
MMPIRVLIVDDHAFLRMSLQLLLGATDDIHVVGICTDGSEVAEATAQLLPDVVLMDVKMPGVNGFEATRRLLAVESRIRVLLLTATFDPSYMTEGKSVGAVGLILKADDPSDLPDRIRAVAAGGTAWGPTLDV